MSALSWLFLICYALAYLAMFLFPVFVIVLASMWWAKLGKRR
ncbi:MAG TPA: hypothetical protein VJY15_24975 [Candidatus Acidoferrum sp.]|nr:hypothetical protein [Candidatus Acidoferrum sp.]